eukprot:762463-Hanusia_phi.AAC.1
MHVPCVLVHTSDEYCNQRLTWRLYSKFRVVLRQYTCYEQYSDLYRQNPNVRVIPLGYMRQMLNFSSLQTASSKALFITEPRKYVWSFVGTVKSNRAEALRIFESVLPHFVGRGSPRMVAEVYSNSYFVLSGRGNKNLDCFRHYEASINGAIPIVIGDAAEINHSFSNFHSLPPWLFATSWEDASRVVQRALLNRENLTYWQLDNLRWWINEMNGIMEHVQSVCGYTTPHLRD